MTPFARRISAVPDAQGRFGDFGGRYVPETLIAALDQLTTAYDEASQDPTFQQEVDQLLRDYVGRPSPLYFAQRLTAKCGGAEIWLKREDLNHTGAHKINNTLGQALLTLRMGKTRVIAETGAGQHGVATATACAILDCRASCTWARRMSAGSRPTSSACGCSARRCDPSRSGSRTLRDAINEAMRDWMTSVREHALHPRFGGRAASLSADRA